MKRFLPLMILLAATVVVSCKSTGIIADNSTHGVDADGNVWMNPPPPEEGLQIAVEPFDVPDSAEVQGNFYFHLPSDVPFDVERIEIAMNEGTHHMNLYKSTVHWPADSGVPRKIVFRYLEGNVDTIAVRYQAEFNATIVRNGGDMMVEAQIPYLNWTFPKLPSGDQTAVHFGANDTLVIENHYVNIGNLKGNGSQTTPNGKGKVIINLWRATSGPVVPASMMFARKINFSLPANKETLLSKDCKFDNQQEITSHPIYILGMTGHFHSRGKEFWVEKVQTMFDSKGNVIGDSVVQEVYRSATWSEPPFTVYDTPVKLELSKGEFLRYHADYVTGADAIPWGAHVATQEHMNLFVWFAPGWNDGATVYDDNN